VTTLKVLRGLAKGSVFGTIGFVAKPWRHGNSVSFDDGGAIAFAHTGIGARLHRNHPSPLYCRVRLAGCRLGYSLAIAAALLF
jgi:hypothetical protein